MNKFKQYLVWYVAVVVFASGAVIGVPNSVLAATVSLTSVDKGWYSGSTNFPSNTNYVIDRGHHDFFVFDLGTVTDTITSAVLRLYNPGANVDGGDGFTSGFSQKRVVIRDVNTDLTSLMNGTGGTAAYNDLANGTLYSDRLVSSADNGTIINFILNSDGILALGATSGLFAVGGSFASTLGDPSSSIFKFTGNIGQASPELLLTTVSTVPLPATLPLFLSGLIGLGIARRGRKRKIPGQ